MKNKHTIIVGFIVFVLVAVLIAVASIVTNPIHNIEPTFETPEKLLTSLDQHKIYAIFKYDEDTIWFVEKDDIIEPKEITSQQQLLELAPKEAWKSTKFKVTEDLYTRVFESGTFYYDSVPLTTNKSDVLMTFNIIGTFVLPLILILSLIAMYRSSLSVGKNTTVVQQAVEKPSCKFSDVIGHDEIISDLRQYISILKNSEILANNHIKQPKGLLLTGAPGTGKTLLAKALAGEAGISFMYLNSSSVINRYVGVGASNIRAAFKKARETSPCILFIDELDAIGSSRDVASGRNSEDNQTLLALLQEMDGFADMAGVLVIGATNCPEALDPALKRTGRFDREIHILPPTDKITRVKMLQLYTKDLKLDPELNLSTLAGQLSGFTGADIAYLCNEAAITAVSRAESEEYLVTLQDFLDAMDKLLLKGNKKASDINKHDKLVTAYHEAGHAIAAILLGEKVTRITIQGTTSGIGGFVLQEQSENSMRTKAQLLNQIKICYAGRASECIKFGDDNCTTGALSDIQHATSYIKDMVQSFGYDAEMGLLDYSQLTSVQISDSAKTRMAEISNKCYDDVWNLLRRHYDYVETLAGRLLIDEELQGDEVLELLNLGGTNENNI